MYIKDDRLHYEARFGGSLCSKCYRHSFAIKEISYVQVFANEHVPVPYGEGGRRSSLALLAPPTGGRDLAPTRETRRRSNLMHLNPGLRVVGAAMTITVAMPDGDAEEFAAELGIDLFLANRD